MVLKLEHKNILLLWSGGFDSTALLIETLQYMRNREIEDNIILLSISDMNTGETKIEKEREARKNILKIINEIFDDIITEIVEINVNRDTAHTSSRFMTGASNGVCQPILWLTNTAAITNNKDILMGYIAGDDAIRHIPYMEELLNISSKITGNEHKLHFPLAHVSKDNVINTILDFDKKHKTNIIDLVISCEGVHSKTKRCNDCVPCRHLKEALLLGLNNADKTKNMKIKLLKEWFNLDVKIKEIKTEKEIMVRKEETIDYSNEDKAYEKNKNRKNKKRNNTDI